MKPVNQGELKFFVLAHFQFSYDSGYIYLIASRYNNKSYKVDDIDFQASPKSTFTNEKGEELSYMDYYKRQYGLEIRDPNQPLLIHRPKKKALNEEDVEKLICLIPELCLLTGMTDAMRADFRIMKEV